MTHVRHILIVATLVGIAGCATSKPVERQQAPDNASASAPSTAETVQALIADAGTLLRSGKAREAKAKYAEALAKDPANVDAKLGDADADLALRNYDAAQTTLETLRTSAPDRRDVLLLLGKVHEARGDYAAGIALYRDALEKGGVKADPEITNHLITLHRLHKAYDQAEKLCRAVLAKEPKNADALKNLSLIYFDQDKYALAETIAINALKLNDKDASLYNTRGMVRVERGRYPEAVSFFKKALEIDPRLLSAHLNLGAIALRYRDYDTAARHYGEAMKLEPRHPEANLGYGFALAGQQKATDAIAQLQRALEIDPEAAEAMGEIAIVTKLQLNDTDGAHAWCGKYREKRGGKLDEKDPFQSECNQIAMELRNKEIAKQQMEKLKAQEEAEQANDRKAPPTTDGAPPPPATK